MQLVVTKELAAANTLVYDGIFRAPMVDKLLRAMFPGYFLTIANDIIR